MVKQGRVVRNACSIPPYCQLKYPIPHILCIIPYQPHLNGDECTALPFLFAYWTTFSLLWSVLRTFLSRLKLIHVLWLMPYSTFHNSLCSIYSFPVSCLCFLLCFFYVCSFLRSLMCAYVLYGGDVRSSFALFVYSTVCHTVSHIVSHISRPVCQSLCHTQLLSLVNRTFTCNLVFPRYCSASSASSSFFHAMLWSMQYGECHIVAHSNGLTIDCISQLSSIVYYCSISLLTVFYWSPSL